MSQDNRVQRLIELAGSAFAAPPGRRRIVIALCFGAICHLLFAVAIASMIYSMFYGLTTGVGQVPYPWALLANLFLVLQFPLAHSLLLTKRGMKVLSSLAPATHGRTLSTTTYAIIASLQLISLFWLWTPSGIIWWEAKGSLFFAVCVAYTVSWLLLIKAIFDAGIDLQSGALGWLSLLAKKAPVFPDMPTSGLFGLIRQPIYLAFAITLWTIPVWTPDQLILAIVWTSYCISAPMLKERRFAAIYQERFSHYQAHVPYMIPKRRKQKTHDARSTK